MNARHRLAVFLGTLPLAAFLGAMLPPDAAHAQDAVRMAMPAFGTEAQIEVRGLDPKRAQEVVRDALTEIHAVQRLLDPEGSEPGGMGYLQAHAGKPVAVDPRLGELLIRNLQYCVWTGGSHSPLAGEIEDLWELRDRTGEGPDPTALRDAVQRAECDRMKIENGPPLKVTVPAGSRLSVFGTAQGFAVDQAIELLTSRGVTNAFVEIGHVVRGLGGGPDGNGWLVVVPGHQHTRNPLDQFWLQNQSLAVVRKDSQRRIDHRTGVPSLGVVQVAAVSQLAVDTEVLAHALFTVGNPDGQRLLGYLNPRPSVFWLLGNGVGTPLESQYRWSSELNRPRKPSY